MTRIAVRQPARLGAAALALTLALAACSSTSSGGGSSAPTDGTLILGLNGDIGQPPDPDIYYANNGVAIIQNVYEGLVKYKDGAQTPEIAPALATAWSVDPTNTVFTFTLRDGVTFHDGTPFTADAVKASFDRRAAVNGGPAYMVAGVQSVVSTDPHTVVITLKEPNSAFLDYLASPFGPRMESPTGLAKNAGNDHAQSYLAKNDLGTGPYQLSKVQTGTEYELTAYPGYWGQKSPFTTVKLPVYNDVSSLELAIEQGEVSGAVNALPSAALQRFNGNANLKNYFLPTLGAALLTLNPHGSFFATQPARMAFLQLIDQQQLVSSVMGQTSEPATTMYGRGMIPDGADKQTITHDPKVMADYAKTLPAGTTMTLGYATNNDNAQKIANLVVAQLQTMGIKASAQGYTTATVFSWPNDPTKGPDAFVDGSNGPDGGNPYMWGHVFWDKTGGINYFMCDNPEVDDMLNSAVKSGDTALYVQAAQAYEQTGCYLNLAYNKDWVVAQKWLTNVTDAHNVGSFELNFNQLGIDTK
ncbi:ABC transporter substrate-binding protein [Mycolicibacterium sp. CBM1]